MHHVRTSYEYPSRTGCVGENHSMSLSQLAPINSLFVSLNLLAALLIEPHTNRLAVDEMLALGCDLLTSLPV